MSLEQELSSMVVAIREAAKQHAEGLSTDWELLLTVVGACKVSTVSEMIVAYTRVDKDSINNPPYVNFYNQYTEV